ncbi:hypothetical protein [Pedobacter cryophilus]|uniref:Lipocalin-like domain-containing protein n=1 Tax=Pedobacter cryophilus TaxID=2571271 RepID=A0A4V5NXC8_9SPHI|nr:hypothetical protein [Pedobacter cryophilus]TKB98793.1 hypothetical protein FA046_06655 [Pedobacter cryophilus]
MKKILLLILTIGVLAFQGCKKDADSAIVTSLKGRWDLTEMKLELFENGVSKQKASENYSKGDAYLLFTETTFKTFTDSQLEGEGTYTFNSSTKTLTLKEGTDVETTILKSFDGKTFVISEEETETINGVITKVIYDAVFTKE